MRIIRKLNVEMDLQGFKPVFLVNNRVMETGLTVRKGFGLLSDEVQCNGTKAWFYAVKIGEYATDRKAQVYKLFVSNRKATTTEYFVRATSLNTIEEETKSVLEKLYGTQIINDVKIYEVEGHVVDFGFKKHELSIYGSTMFGLLVSILIHGNPSPTGTPKNTVANRHHLQNNHDCHKSGIFYRTNGLTWLNFRFGFLKRTAACHGCGLLPQKCPGGHLTF